MTIYKWKEYEQAARAHVTKNRDPANPLLSLAKAREEFDGLAKHVHHDLFDASDDPIFSRETYKQLLKLGQLARDYQCALDEEPDISVDMEDREETRIEHLAKFLRYPFVVEMWENAEAEMKKIAVLRIEVDEMIDKRDDDVMQRELSKLEETLRDPDCTKEKIMAVNRLGWSLAGSMHMDKRYFERFAELMEDAKVGNFVPMDQEELPLEGDQQWTKESMLEWLEGIQKAAKTLVQTKEELEHTPP